MNKFYVNKKLVALIVIVITLALILLTGFENKISVSFGLTDEEKDFIKDQTTTLTINLSDHYIYRDKLNELENNIIRDLGLEINFSLNSNVEHQFYSYPTAVYKRTNLNQMPAQVMKISSTNILQAISEFNTSAYDAIQLPYEGDYLSEHDLKIYSLDYTQYTPFYTDADGLLLDILVKVFDKYQKDAVFMTWIDETNYSTLIASPEIWIKNRTRLRVGIARMPPIAYIKTPTIYGFATAYLNNIAEASNVSIEYTIGETDVLNDMIVDEKLDLVLSQTPTLAILEEPYVMVSTFDTAFYDEDYLIAEFIHVNNQSFDDLMEMLDKHYIKMPLSMYEFILEKKEIDQLYFNQLSSETIRYGFIGDETLLVQLEHYNDFIDEQRLLDLSLHYIPNEKGDRTRFNIVIVSSIVLVFLGLVYVVVRIIMSINEKQRLNYLFKHDQLTYLLNHYGLKKYFSSLSLKNGIMMLVDIRRFKLLNDTFGSDIGDQVLIELSTIFDAISEHLIVARTSGDQFTFLLNESDYEHYLKLITDAFETYKTSEPHTQKLDLSTCYVRFPEFTDEFDTLIQYLESAMYYAKSLNIINEWIAFDHDIYKNYVEEQELALEIQLAIDREELILFYQPQTELRTEKTIGAEVLVRWVHKERGNIYPDQFLGVAERNGLMRKLDMYMIKKACEQIKYWQDENYKKMKISVNMSTYTFESLKMSDELLNIVSQSGIDTGWFAIEITEESGFSNLKKAKVAMDEIKAYGIRFALDDFGKGYSSISYLEQLPFDFLKIDKAFVDNIHTNEKSKVLYYLITDLANLYDMHIIAEGVEYIEQIEVIKKDLETIIQGYYYSKPLTLEDFDERLRNQ